MMARTTLTTVTVVILSLLHQGVTHQGVSQDGHIKDMIIPEQPMRYDNVTLECLFDYKENPIVISWRHNGLEFLQFRPNETDPITLFTDGLNVTINLNETTGHKVALTRVDLSASGTYSCFIMGHDFREATLTKSMTVVEIPDDKPSIEGDVQDHFKVGDIVNLTCSTPPSFPAATLSWYINEKKAPKKFLHEYAPKKTLDGLYVSRLRLNFKLSQTHFIKDELRLKCVATIARLYSKTNEHSQQEPSAVDEPPVNEVKLPEEGSLVTTGTGTSGSTSVWISLPHVFLLQAVLFISACLLH